ncbi:transposase-like protein [Bradyrhizobium elkanii]
MSELHLIRKRCPHCGRAMKLVCEPTGRGRERYVCPACEEDNPAAQKWADSPLRPPAR